MKKKRIVGIVIIIILVIIGTTVAMNFRTIIYEVTTITGGDFSLNYGGVEEFEKYKSDYEVVANIAYDYYLKNKKENLWFAMGFDESKDEYYYYTLIDDNSEVGYISYNFELSDLHKQSIKNICKYSFVAKGGASFDVIRVRENIVSFDTVNGIYSLVYSVNGSVPKYLNKPNEDKYVRYERLNENWYNQRKIG